ncbi:ABC transporter ATP-binding protein [Actinomadura physcomitrii]|nr:ATP-binding cassette domain-containing protein [Actinomadura physcomitrii]
MKSDDVALSIDGVSVQFGGVWALQEVGFELEAGTTLGLIGPNGAGKTTLLNVISRIHRDAKGDIRLHGESIARLSPHHLTTRGLARTFQSPPALSELSVRELLQIGYVAGQNSRRGRHRLRRGSDDRLIDEVLAGLGLLELRDEGCSSLAYAEQKLADLGRALCQRPSVLLLDEPCAGLNAEEKREFVDVIRGVQEERPMSVVLVEHDIETVLAVSDRVLVLSFGRKIAETDPSRVMDLPEVRREYLGEAE